MNVRALAVSLVAASFAPQSAPPAEQPVGAIVSDYDGPYARAIFFAVLEGLYTDGVPTDVVDGIVAIDERTGWPTNFVYACPICLPAFDAFTVYQKRPKFSFRKGDSDTFGPGLPEELTERLRSTDALVRQPAIQELVESWVRRRMDSLRLTDEERAAWRVEMAKRRKQGMGLLQQYQQQRVGGTYADMKSCPLCEGANGACEKR